MPYQVKLADSNCALIGSSLDLEARVRAAHTEDEWKEAGKTDGIQVWRVEQFKIKPIPLNDYGTFFDGDSYIVLRTIESKKESGETVKSYDIHFWLGKLTSIDEQGVAAYKTVELDDFLGTLPKQHREVQGTESNLFLSYFKKANNGSGVKVLHGGVATGFNHVDQSLEKGRRTASDSTRLWHVKGRANVRVYEVKQACKSLNKGDAFILDAITKIFVWIGPKASIQEKFKCATILTSMQDDRSDSAQVFKVGEGSREDRDLKAEEEFFSLLQGSPSDIQDEVPDVTTSIPQDCRQKRLFKVSDSSGELLCTLVAEGDAVKTDLLKGEDVYILDVGNHVYIWVGEDSSKGEKSKAMPIAMKYVSTRGYLPQVPITRVADNLEDSDFLSYFSQ